MSDLQEEILDNYDIHVHSYKNVDVDDIPKFLKKIDSITHMKENSIIQLLYTDHIAGETHLKQAIAHAITSFNQGNNFANDKGLEVCVRLSGQKQINVALNMLGIKNSGNITVLYIECSSEQITKTEQLLTSRDDSLLEEYDKDEIIKTYDLGDDDNIIDLLCEKIALLSIKT
ncbi:MAG: KEOPS complex subunit Cgi121 [Methanosphaera sp.]|nr:KEOPS complex subunit Cgi121 [Methanosphaera sp.]